MIGKWCNKLENASNKLESLYRSSMPQWPCWASRGSVHRKWEFTEKWAMRNENGRFFIEKQPPQPEQHSSVRCAHTHYDAEADETIPVVMSKGDGGRFGWCWIGEEHGSTPCSTS